MPKFRTLAIGLGIGALLALTSACAPAPSTSPESTETSAPPASEEPDDAQPTQAPDGPVDASGAIDAALAHTPGAVVEVHAEGSTWEVTVLREDGTGLELYIDAATGQVVREQDKRLDPTQRSAPAVTASKAIDAALAEVPGSIVEIDLGLDRSTLVWEALIDADAGGRFEVYVDAANGSIRKTERDD